MYTSGLPKIQKKLNRQNKQKHKYRAHKINNIFFFFKNFSIISFDPFLKGMFSRYAWKFLSNIHTRNLFS